MAEEISETICVLRDFGVLIFLVEFVKLLTNVGHGLLSDKQMRRIKVLDNEGHAFLLIQPYQEFLDWNVAGDEHSVHRVRHNGGRNLL